MRNSRVAGTFLIVCVSLAFGPSARAGADCNGNGVSDATDISSGTSQDCNENGIPDECDTDVLFVEHPITAAAPFSRWVTTADVDGDGDSDVLAAYDDRFVWYENIDGNGGFGAERPIGAGAISTRAVVAADLDGDGDPDALAASAGDSTIAWYENTNGLGLFGPRQVISATAVTAWSVFAADLDGDGDLDALSASQADDTIAWYENTDGAGTFGPERIIATDATEALSVSAIDVDDDGDTDVLSASFGDSTIAWYENTDGVGFFGPPQIVTTNAAGAASVFPVDLDDDGDPDLLSASFLDNKIAWYRKTDDLDDYGPPQVISTAKLGPVAVHAADLDGDGDADVLSASQSDSTIAWYRNSGGAGSFDPLRTISNDVLAATSVHAADLDGDGDIDVLSSSLAGEIVWYENTGDDCNGNGVPDGCEPDCNSNGIADGCELDSGAGTDCNANQVPDDCDISEQISDDCAGEGVPDECEPDCNANLAADSCDIDDLTSEDCTGNGIPDECEPDCNANLAADSCDIDDLTSADCTGDGIPDECEPDCNANLAADSCDLDDLTSEDCEANGIPDECDVTAGASDCNLNLIPDGCETALTFSRHLITDMADFARSVVAADVDVDGDPDVIAAAGIDDTVAWYENTDGAGSFGPEQIITTDTDLPLAVFAADVDGDRDVDVLSASLNDNRIAWYENEDTVGGYGPQQIISNQAQSARAVWAADLDGDLDIDVLSSSNNDNKIAWYRNLDGKGSFGPQKIISLDLDGPRGVFAVDLDGDLDIDVLSASVVDDKVAWYENKNGLGSFGPQRVISLDADGARSVYAADLDGDLDLDVLSASQDDDKLAWYENTDGLGLFGPQRLISTAGNGPIAVSVADLDADGDLDVLAASFFDNHVSWYENIDGLGSFSPQRVVSAIAHGVSSLFVTDLDADGDLDVLVTSQFDDTLAWYENESDDCNGNLVPDACDLTAATSQDCTGNGVPDECEPDCNANLAADSCDIADRTSDDCNANGFPDDCEPDCNQNGVADSCDVTGASSTDCNANGVPDECDTDCNANGTPDDCDIAGGGSPDCNGNGLPDECEPDCNASGMPDDCDISGGQSNDCDGNDVPDECDPDCNGDGQPNACDDDCNLNEIPDGCEPDCNENGIADSCDIGFGPTVDCNGNDVPDECEAVCQLPCDVDHDRCKDPFDANPANKFACSDVDLDGCDDCSSGFWNKLNDGPDADQDGYCDVGDCDTTSPGIWAEPAAVDTLLLSRSAGNALLAWQPPLPPGGEDPQYDTLRSEMASDFHDPAVCLETLGSDTEAEDLDTPTPGAVFHYLIRVTSGCPGSPGTLGPASSGIPRTGRTCP